MTLAAVLAVAAAGVATVMLTAGDADRDPIVVRDVGIDVRDGPNRDEYVRLDATIYLPRRTPAPAILLAHGFGGSKESVVEQARDLAGDGFVVLAYTARGFGRSTGQIALNSPDYEVVDAQALVDWLAARPEVRTDRPGDPRIGVSGSSYGGALALMLAGTDRRIDAVVPMITWNDLSAALLPNAAGAGSVTATTPAAGIAGADGVFKRDWAGIFFSAGLAPGAGAGPQGEAPEPGADDDSSGGSAGDSSGDSSGGTAGLDGAAGTATSANGASAGQLDPGRLAAAQLDPRQLGCGRFRPEVCQAYVDVATTGRATPAAVELLRRSSPLTVADRITAPTLLIQGELDTLFGLDHADATARQIASAGGPVKVVWYAGGHDGGSPGPALRAKITQWFGFHLDGRGTDPGTGFEYDVQGTFQRSGAPSVRTVFAEAYPGLDGGGAANLHSRAAQRRTIELGGPAQPVFVPAGGSPAATSSVPGLSGLLGRFRDRLTLDVPGQSAVFASEPAAEQLLIAGSPHVRLRVSGLPGAAPTEAVLFAKLYDVAPDGSRTLPGGGVAPIRLALPADGSPAEVTVALPGIVRPLEPEHRLALVVSTTDRAFAGATQPAVHLVEAGGSLSVPVVPGRSAAGTEVPRLPLVGLGAVLAALLVIVAAAALRGRRSDRGDPALAGVPLVINGLTKSYPGGLVAVDDLSLRVESGQVLGLLGPNGAGKTTTLRMLMGLIRPNSGNIRVYGHRVEPGAPVLSRLGSFVEGPGFLPHLSGLENLRLFWAATGRPAADARMGEALEVAGLGNAVHRRVSTYSHGMKQRLAIAQAMLGMPELLVLDEPTNGLDPPQIREMRAVLRRYAATGRTVVVSSHLLAEVEQTCSHVVVMHRGRLVAAGPVADIVAGGGQASFTVDDPDAASRVLSGADGVTGVSTDGYTVHADLGPLPRSFAVTALVQAGVAVESAGPRRRLEDAFLQLVGEEVGR